MPPRMRWQRLPRAVAVDRISSLPDETLCHILSFLPTKLSVTTSILSKRWYPLWRSVPALNLSINTLQRNGDDYRESVSWLRYHVHQDDDVNHVNVWLNCVTKHCGVEHLELDCGPLYGGRFPNYLRTTCCKSLVVLKLRAFEVIHISNVEIELPSLKILHLEFLRFANDTFLALLVSRCPNLEDFKAIHCVSQSLLDRYSSDYEGDDFGSDDSNSKEDEWDGIKSLAKLVRAEIDKSTIQFSMEMLNNVGQLILNIHKAVPCCNQIGTFHNLTHLQLYFSTHKWQWLIEMLHHCPKLKILAIRKEERQEIRFDSFWGELDLPKI